ncbi:hypothetical protein EYR36_007788 [Pleurotus pulmonarius]|nr:hypothetical protein EYR36_007788 [Pleurotus pulmonarius]
MSFHVPETVRQLNSVVNTLVEKRQESPCSDDEVGGIIYMGDLVKILDSVTLVEVDTRGAKRLCVEDKQSQQPTELQARMSGVLLSHELPPRLRVMDPNARIYARQHVTLSGLGTQGFSNGVDSLRELSDHLAHFFEEGCWMGWAPSDHLGFPALEANSRYYTLRSSQLFPNDQPFPKDVDPRGFLERGKGTEFVYTEDNLVEFWKYNEDENSYIPFNPREFKDGDIVEAHVSFLMVKMSTGAQSSSSRFKAPPKYRMLVTLRGLTLLARNDHKMARFFEKHDVHLMVLDLLSIQDLRIYGLVCERTYKAVKEYLRQNAKVTRLLKTFIDKDSISRFRRMQRATGAIIGGSAALQFFTRQEYTSSDLDLYVHFTYFGKVCCALKKLRCSKDPRKTPDGSTAPPSSVYLGPFIKQIVDFTTSKNRKIQLIVTRRRPVDVILSYHSTTVMNFLTGWYAYSLYGKETLQLGVALYNPNAFNLPAMKHKWETRGWTEVSSEAEALQLGAFERTARSVGDDLTCIVKLSIKGVEGDAKYRDTEILFRKEHVGENCRGLSLGEPKAGKVQDEKATTKEISQAFIQLRRVLPLQRPSD